MSLKWESFADGSFKIEQPVLYKNITMDIQEARPCLIYRGIYYYLLLDVWDFNAR
jgi:hypothetical protein